VELADFVAHAVRVPFVDRGRGFRGWDCWGLVVAAYREVLGAELPSMVYRATAEPADDLDRVVHKRLPSWSRVDGLYRPMDLAVYVTSGAVSHVALIIDPLRALHAHEGIGTVVEPLRSSVWSRCLEGVYRAA